LLEKLHAESFSTEQDGDVRVALEPDDDLLVSIFDNRARTNRFSGGV